MPKVAQQIIEEAKKEAAEILAKAEAEAREIESAREEIAKKKAHAILHAGQSKAHEQRKQILASARFGIKQADVERKGELVSGVFEEAVARLSKIPLSEIFPEKPASNPLPGSRLFVAKRDLSWAKKNFKGEVLEAKILGGYILESGKRTANNSFDVVLENFKGEYSGKALRAIKVSRQ